MKKHLTDSIAIPEGLSCTLEGTVITCSKGSAKVQRDVGIRSVTVSLANNKITFDTKKGSKREFKMIQSQIAHLKNLFIGIQDKFVYQLESCNVHFPMTLKQEKGRLAINNFLGEKTPRYAIILPNVDVEIKGQKITISSHDKDAAGKTAANFEKATKVRNRDRRIFQDGIFITAKAGRQS